MNMNKNEGSLRRGGIAIALAIALAGCAQVPTLGPAPAMAPDGALQASDSLAGPTGQWPADDWWKGFGDVQLDLLMADALRDAPSLATAQARLERAQAATQLAGAALNPTVEASAGAARVKQSYNNGVPAAFVPQGWNGTANAGFNLDWELDFWGRNRAALAAATSAAQAAAFDRAQARLALTAAIASSYAEFTRLRAARATAERALEVRRQTAALFGERERSGLETRGSLRQVQAKQAQAEAELLAIDESIRLQQHHLAYLAGAGPDRTLRLLTPVVDIAHGAGLPTALPAELLGRRPDVAAARARVEAMAQRVKQSRAAFYPNVNLTAAIGFQSLGLDMLTRSGSLAGSVGPAISLPIFNTARLQGQYREANADYAEAVASYNDTLTQALREVADAAVSQNMLASRLERTEAAAQAAEEAWRIARNRYQGGLATYLEVLNAEDALLGNTRELTALHSRRFALNIQMIRALGGGVGPRQG